MANHKSALKRARQNKNRQLRNNSKKTRIKNVIKALEAAIAEKSTTEIREHMRLAQKAIAKTAAKGIIHKRTASRNISRLSRKVQVLIKAQAAG
ncbi:MAG: 30S ribosomal protein S20 [Thermodesulfobacteriota bacterium]|nr:30S ribosomal protein S20 [Thermodesulfobacteriota bacterium]